MYRQLQNIQPTPPPLFRKKNILYKNYLTEKSDDSLASSYT